MDNTPNGPYKHYERPSHGRADNEQQVLVEIGEL